MIGPDFYKNQQLSFIDEEDKFRVNAFDWQAAFPHALRAGGFDAVIGNPPYVRQETLSEFKDYFEGHYESFDGVADLYVYFMEKGIRLLREGGYYSIIVSNSFLRTTYALRLREFLKKHIAIIRVVDFGGLAVFENAKDTYVCIPLLSRRQQSKRVEVANANTLDFEDLGSYIAPRIYTIPVQRLSGEVWSLKSDAETRVFEKIMRVGQPLGSLVEGRFFRGVTTGLNEAFIIDSKTRELLIARDRRSAEVIKPLLAGEDIRKWEFNNNGAWLIFTRRGFDIESYPAIREHLFKWKAELTPKKSSSDPVGRKPGKYKWFEIQDDVAYYRIFESPKIIFPDIAKGPRFCLDTCAHYLANTAYCLGTDDRFLLGILNSRIFWFAIGNISIPFGVRAGEYRYRLIYQYMEKVPIRTVDLSVTSDKALHSQIIDLVDCILLLHRKKSSGKLAPSEIERLQREIAATDAQIDHLVYRLYGITDEERTIIETQR